MKIRITSKRKPWVNDAPQDFGAVVECSADDGKAMVKAGLAEEIRPRKQADE